jgi:hypothetical protein
MTKLGQSLSREREVMFRFTNTAAVILRCELLRASKDGREHGVEQHPSRLAQKGSHLRANAIAFVPGMTVVCAGNSTESPPGCGFAHPGYDHLNDHAARLHNRVRTARHPSLPHAHQRT